MALIETRILWIIVESLTIASLFSCRAERALIRAAHRWSAIAQLVEQLTVNQPVAGSSPARGANQNPRPLGGGFSFWARSSPAATMPSAS